LFYFEYLTNKLSYIRPKLFYMNELHYTLKNNEAVALSSIPTLPYKKFAQHVSDLLEQPYRRCVLYYGFPLGTKLKFLCGIADDAKHIIDVCSYELNMKDRHELPSLTEKHYAMHIYEREIAENWQVNFSGHPWLKPVRYAHNRNDKKKNIANYPFYQITSDQLHEVGVGPIHAGVIEPGHFRFICNGEKVLHLEIQLGFQHRGIEQLMIDKKHLLQRTTLAENITGDTTVGHTLAFVSLMETLGNIKVSERLHLERATALELERIAIHVGDLSAMFTDIAYQLGASVLGALRTPVINYAQWWCGNRFAKSLIRVGGSHYPLHDKLIERLNTLLNDFIPKFQEMNLLAFNMPSVLSRFENIGTITAKQAQLIGAVGMPARICGLPRDIRYSHPFAAFKEIPYKPATEQTGDVYARGLLRKIEIEKSILLLQTFTQDIAKLPPAPKPQMEVQLQAHSFAISMTEGWRGEIVHSAVTDENGELAHYKVKDPSFHNWLALALALRNQEISDFPINNKSFDLSYCGFDL
jgi:Ni,Fe-hydrogenase III large subunit